MKHPGTGKNGKPLQAHSMEAVISELRQSWSHGGGGELDRSCRDMDAATVTQNHGT